MCVRVCGVWCVYICMHGTHTHHGSHCTRNQFLFSLQLWIARILVLPATGPGADYRPPPMALQLPSLVTLDTFSMATVRDGALTMDCGQGQPLHVEVQRSIVSLNCSVHVIVM